ncbi:DedA family protein [Fredinandcohnia humi]
MEINEVIRNIIDYGYIGFYFWLWFGAFAIPIPNEVIVSTIGFFASEDLLIPWRIFLVTYAGILTAVTTSYILGRFAGKTMFLVLNKRRSFQRKFDKALAIIERFKTSALAFSYFVPGFRILIPFVFGFSKLPYIKFASILYPAVLIWVSLIFSVGYFAGEEFITAFIKYYDIVIGFAVVFFVLYVSIRLRRARNMRKLSH